LHGLILSVLYPEQGQECNNEIHVDHHKNKCIFVKYMHMNAPLTNHENHKNKQHCCTHDILQFGEFQLFAFMFVDRYQSDRRNSAAQRKKGLQSGEEEEQNEVSVIPDSDAVAYEVAVVVEPFYAVVAEFTVGCHGGPDYLTGLAVPVFVDIVRTLDLFIERRNNVLQIQRSDLYGRLD